VANLDNLESIQELDRENILGNIQDFPDQVEKCWEDWQKIALPTPFINAKSILILGMGGSGQGGGIVASMAEKETNVPIIVFHDYDIPGWVDKNTLVIAVSYSGSTEETLVSFSQACKLTDKLITISTGGELYSLGTQHKALHYRVHYGSQPRAAIGFNLTSVLAILSKLHILEVSNDDVKEAVLLLRGLNKKLDVNVSKSRNGAKILAEKVYGKIPIIFGSGNLSEVARRIKGSFNENAKTASYSEILPELNHTSLVGLEFPDDLKQKLFFIVLQSKYDNPRNTLRQNITAQIIQQKRIPCETIMMQPSGNPIAEVLQIIHFFDFTSYYLAILNNVAPEPVEIIKFLKDKLNEQPINKE